MGNNPRLPASIKVAHRDIAVVLTPHEVLSEEDKMADYCEEMQRIRLGDWLPPQTKAETLIHELLHACWPRWPVKGEEAHVESISPVLAQVWRDNPRLVAWLSHSLSGKEAR